MAEDIHKHANGFVPLPPAPEYEGYARCSRRQEHIAKGQCNAQVVASEDARRIPSHPREFYGSVAAAGSFQRHPRSHLPTKVFSPCGLVDGVICGCDHSFDGCGGMVVEISRG